LRIKSSNQSLWSATMFPTVNRQPGPDLDSVVPLALSDFHVNNLTSCFSFRRKSRFFWAKNSVSKKVWIHFEVSAVRAGNAGNTTTSPSKILWANLVGFGPKLCKITAKFG